MTQLAEQLQALLASLDALLELLAEEAELLTHGKADELASLSQRKSPHLLTIARTWAALADGFGLARNVASETLAERIHGLKDPALAQLWARTEAGAREVGRRNNINGKLIQEQIRHAHAAVQVLQEAANKGGLYGADGQSLAVFSNKREIDSV